MTTLAEVYRRLEYKSDKGHSHNYIGAYNNMFSSFQDKPIVFCELGVQAGPSLLLWDQWLIHPDTIIYGIDIDLSIIMPEIKKDYSSRVKLIEGDIMSLSSHPKAKDLTFDLAIDDGGHHLGVWLASLDYFIPRMNKGGIFCIEDALQLNQDGTDMIGELASKHSSTKIFDCRGPRSSIHGSGEYSSDSMIIAYYF